jgi:hypothetical protein
MSLLVRAELAAHAIWVLGVAVLPALCQTAGYARAVELSGHRQFTPAEVDVLVELRLARADALATAEPRPEPRGGTSFGPGPDRSRLFRCAPVLGER